mgnify:CR=1 FL=1
MIDTLEFELPELEKRHSFPYTHAYSWNLLKTQPTSRYSFGAELRKIKENTAPVISSEGTRQEREERLETAVLWIRKELVSVTSILKYLRQK